EKVMVNPAGSHSGADSKSSCSASAAHERQEEKLGKTKPDGTAGPPDSSRRGLTNGSAIPLAEAVEKPGAGVGPVSGRRRPRNSQHVGGFLLVHAGEEAEFDELGLVWFLNGKLFEGFIELDDVVARPLNGEIVLAKI